MALSRQVQLQALRAVIVSGDLCAAEAVNFLIARALTPVDTDGDGDGEPPLLLVMRLHAFVGQLRIARMLIEAGASLDVEYTRNRKTWSARSVAEHKFEGLTDFITSSSSEM